MLRKIFAIMLVIACAFAVMPKFTHAAAQNDIAFEPQANVVVGSQTRTGRISYSLQFNIGRAATLIEIAPAGTGAWTTFLKKDQTPAAVENLTVGFFSQVIYNTNLFDIRVNGVIWHNVELKADRLVVLGYDYEPVIVLVQDHYRR